MSEANPETAAAPLAPPVGAASGFGARVKSRWTRRLVLAALAAAAALALRFTLFAPKPVPVTVFRVAPGPVEETVTNSKAGTVKSRHRATLSPELGGRVRELPVREGERVRAGQVLLRLNDADYRAQVEAQIRSLEAARASERETGQTLGQAERDLERNRRLAGERIVPQSLVDQLSTQRDVARSAREAARARVSQAEAALELARVNLEKTVLVAPFDGVLAEVSTELGEWITPSPPGIPIPAVIELIDPDAIYVSAPLDEVDVAKVRAGLPVRMTLDAFPGQTFTGRLARVSPYVLDKQEQNRTFEVEVELDDQNMARQLRPGTSADVAVVLARKESSLRIPSYALMEGGRVMVVEGGRLAVRKVETGLKNWDFAEVTRGLAPGDSVVVSLDRPEVKEGARARVDGEALK